jgi:hypothetical protein
VVLQDPSNSPDGQTDTELDQLALDAAVAPLGILPREADHKGCRALVHSRASRSGADRSSAERPASGARRGEWLVSRRKSPTGRGEQAAQRGQERPVCWLVGRTPNLASEHSVLVAQGQWLHVVGTV